MQCPHCQIELPLAIAGTGRCPACAYQLTQADIANWLDELDQAVTSETDFSLAHPADLNRTISELKQTLQSDQDFVLESNDPTKTVASISQTVELESSPQDQGRQTWSDANQATWDGSQPRDPEALGEQLGATLDSSSFPALPAGLVSGSLVGDFELADPTVIVNDPKKTTPITATLFQSPDPGSTIDSATLDSATMRALGRVSQHDSNADVGGTFDERRIASTLDSAQLSHSQGEELAGLWRGTYAPTTTPRMTIKRDSRVESPKDSRLVIKPKAFVNTPQPVGSTSTLTPSIKTGADYELLNVIGEGGVGVVYAARQASIDRTVALKMLKPAGAKSPEQREKFLSEAVVTADLDHPNIVPIYELGSNEIGALFYSMKKVQGTPWSKVIEQKSLIENLEILMKVADAVGFAHARGVIHRDLKPENIMLGEFGEVLVMDWGLAVATAEFRKSATITQTTSMGGTPAYMAPEMAAGPLDNVGPVSDVYLLGAMLFEMLTGQTPHTGKTVMKCLVSAARNEIQPSAVTGELMDIALRAMATNMADRPQSVKDFQHEIRTYEAHSESLALEQRADEMLLTARGSQTYEDYARTLFEYEEAVQLWSGNTRAATGACAVRLQYAELARSRHDLELADSLLLSDEPTHAALKQQLIAEIADEKARIQRLKTARRVMLGMAALIALLITGALVWVNHERGLAVEAEKVAVKARDQEAIAKDDAVKQKQFAEQARDQELVARQQAEQERLAADKARLAAEQAEIAAKQAEQTAVIQRDRATSAEKTAVEAKNVAEQAKAAEEYAAYIARIGLAAAKVDENAFGDVLNLLNECPPAFRNWEWGRLHYLCGRAEATIPTRVPLDVVVASPDGALLAIAGNDGKIRVFARAAADKPLLVIPFGGDYVQALAWSPDGLTIAAGGHDAEQHFLKLYDSQSGQLRQQLDGHTDAVTSLQFSRSGKLLLSSSYDQTARVWDLASNKLQRTLQGHSWWVWSAEWSPNERFVVTAGQDGKCIVWDLQDQNNGQNLAGLNIFTGHTGPIYTATWLPDGERIASAGYNQQILLWQRAAAKPFPFDKLAEKSNLTQPEFQVLAGHQGPVRHLRAFNDGTARLVSSSDDNTLRVWDVNAKQMIQTLRGHSGRVAKAALLDAGRVVSASHDGLVKVWNLAGYEEARVLRGKLLSGHQDAILAADFSQTGQQIVTASGDRSAMIWNSADGKQLHSLSEGHQFLATSIALFPNGQRFATAAMDNTTRIWNLASGVEERCLTGTGRTAVIAIANDGEHLVTASAESAAQVWDVNTGMVLFTLPDHRGEVTAAAWSSDDQFIATADTGGRIKLWDAKGKLLWSADRHSASVTGLAFDPAGKRLWSASNDNSVGCSQVTTGQELVAQVWQHKHAVQQFVIQNAKDFAATVTSQNQVQLWQPSAAKSLRILTGIAGRVTGLALSPTADRLAVISALEAKQLQATGALPQSVVQIYETATGREIPEQRLNQGSIWTATWLPGNQQLLTVGGNGAKLWELSKQTSTMSFLSHGAIGSVQFSPDNQTVLTASADSTAKLWNGQTGQGQRKLPLLHRGAINAARYSGDGQWIATASDDGTALVWDVKTLTVTQTLKTEQPIRAVAWYPDHQQLVTVGVDRTPRIWNALTGQLVKALAVQPAVLTSVAVDPAGKYLVIGSQDQTARVFDATTGELQQTLVGHTAEVTSVAIAPDGRRVLTGSVDTAVKIWDTQSAKELLTLSGHSQAVTVVRFSTDGQQVLSASRDGTAILWLAETWQEPGEGERGIK